MSLLHCSRFLLALTLIVALTGCSEQQGTPTLSDYATGQNTDLSHTWHNNDGSRTHRYDSGGNTHYKHQTAESVKSQDDIKGAAIAIAIAGAVKGGEAIYQWWNTPSE